MKGLTPVNGLRVPKRVAFATRTASNERRNSVAARPGVQIDRAVKSGASVGTGNAKNETPRAGRAPSGSFVKHGGAIAGDREIL
jgi:hypothetical protein